MVCFPLELRRLKHERRVIAAKPLELAALLFGRVWARVVCAHEAPDSAAAAGLFSGLQSWT